MLGRDVPERAVISSLVSGTKNLEPAKFWPWTGPSKRQLLSNSSSLEFHDMPKRREGTYTCEASNRVETRRQSVYLAVQSAYRAAGWLMAGGGGGGGCVPQNRMAVCSGGEGGCVPHGIMLRGEGGCVQRRSVLRRCHALREDKDNCTWSVATRDPLMYEGATHDTFGATHPVPPDTWDLLLFDTCVLVAQILAHVTKIFTQLLVETRPICPTRHCPAFLFSYSLVLQLFHTRWVCRFTRCTKRTTSEST